MEFGDVVLYIALSAIEAFAVLLFILLVFRINIRDFWAEGLIGTSLIAVATYFFAENQFLSNISPLLIALLYFLILVFLFRVSVIHAVFVTIFGYATCFLIQGLIIYIGTLIIPGSSIETIRNDDLTRYSFQLFSSIFFVCLAKFLSKKGYVFTFVPYTPSFKFKLSPKNISLLISSCLAIIAIGLSFDIDSLLIGLLILALPFALFLYMGIIRETTSFD